MEDNRNIIAKLLFKHFNVAMRYGSMYSSGDNKPQEPALYFRLNEDNNQEKHYQLIEEAIESFNGELTWRFGKSEPSRINYEIVPKAIRDVIDSSFEKTGEYYSFRNLVSENQFMQILEIAIEDIPNLHKHMSDYFDEKLK